LTNCRLISVCSIHNLQDYALLTCNVSYNICRYVYDLILHLVCLTTVVHYFPFNQIQIFTDKQAKFKEALKKYLITHSFRSVDEFVR
jgi:hypothetical protein